MASLTGDIEQIPPMYSAVKVNGRKLYEYARKGEQVERPVRTVHIDSIELLDEATAWRGQNIQFRIRIRCGKGTYIRTLAVQIGEALGYPAHMSQLTRTQSGSFTKEQCVTLAEVEEIAQNGDIDSILQPLSYGLSIFPFEEIAADLLNGIVQWQKIVLMLAADLLFISVSVAVFYAGVRRYESGNRIGARL